MTAEEQAVQRALKKRTTDIQLPNEPPPGWQPADEQRFKQWYAQVAKERQLNPDPDDPLHHYDYRAAFKSGARPDADAHWPSEFKRAGHPNRFVGGVDTQHPR